MTNFDLGTLLIGPIGQAPAGATLSLRDEVTTTLPPIQRTIYIHDPAAGDGGVRWVRGDPTPYTQRDLARGVYRDLNMATPVGGNPTAVNLTSGYWHYLRASLKRKLFS